ncbi:MAG: hypothetical protein CME62_07955 [Halobacteriovoraceae bacterium]|nr:hypothetical protein [Halobacteriovoraceae bacterium]|tara:strand:+ start:10681 stop:11172 length:492 start_codon:yes stop_codon:yes gene_type:complete
MKHLFFLILLISNSLTLANVEVGPQTTKTFSIELIGGVCLPYERTCLSLAEKDLIFVIEDDSSTNSKKTVTLNYRGANYDLIFDIKIYTKRDRMEVYAKVQNENSKAIADHIMVNLSTSSIQSEILINDPHNMAVFFMTDMMDQAAETNYPVVSLGAKIKLIK